LELVRQRFNVVRGLGARYRCLLDIRVGAKNFGCQSHQHDALLGALVGGLGLVVSAGGVFGMASRHGLLVDIAGGGFGGSTG